MKDDRSPRPDPFRLSQALERLDREGLLVLAPDADPLIEGVQEDSRRVRAGDLFCAWTGSSADGHRFVGAAQAAGAVAALVEEPVPDSGVPQVVVRDGRRAAGAVAAMAYGDPGRALRIVGVTGTNGKTTTVWLLRHLLGARHAAASLGTLGAVLPDGSPLWEGESLTTPGPVELAATLAALVRRGVDAVAMEVSSHALDQGRAHALRFAAGVFTNVSRDHLDYHGTEEAYREAKRSLVELLEPDGVAVINADDAAWAGLAERAPRALRFGIEGRDAEVRAEIRELGPFGARFRLETTEGAVDVESPLLGGFNVQNVLGAAAACLALGFAPREVAERVATTPQVPGRLERIAVSPCPVLTDYAHTPDALDRVLAALKPLVRGRLIVVFGAGGDRDRGKRPLMGSVVEQWADVPIVTSDNPRTEDPDVIINEILGGMRRGNRLRVTDRREAIERALRIARPDDLILLAGKGHETYQVIGTDKVVFDEREIVQDLSGTGAPGVTA